MKYFQMLDWENIETVLLDMDGTLLDLHFDNYFWLEHLPARYAEHHGLSEEEALSELNKSFVGLRGISERAASSRSQRPASRCTCTVVPATASRASAASKG